MEENVALDSSKQKKFVKSIKKLIKKSDKEPKETKESIDKVVKDGIRKAKSKRPERGLVYLSHIPHGFYEHEMTQYFKQFGVVTNVRVIRSKRTGNSKGYAFVEFKEPTVAEIVAETMNNYLMGKRIIKAALIPPEKQRPKAMRKHWNRVHNPGAEARLKMKKAYNENKDEKGELKKARKIINNLNKTKNKLSELGIDYDFFTPVDVPDALVSLLENNKSNNQSTDEIKGTNNKVKRNKDIEENTKALTKKTLKDNIPKTQSKQDKKEKVTNQKVDKKVQKSKENKLKEAGVKPAEEFIKIQEESDGSDSSLDFDTDEYEKMMGDDDDDGSENEIDSDEDGGESEENSELEEESEEEVPPTKKAKGKKGPIMNTQDGKQKTGKPIQKKQTEITKRKISHKQITSKKPKFEKQTQQIKKKQFKKK